MAELGMKREEEKAKIAEWEAQRDPILEGISSFLESSRTKEDLKQVESSNRLRLVLDMRMELVNKLKMKNLEFYTFPAAYILLILFVEMGTAIHSPEVGIGFYSMVLFIILAHSAIAESKKLSEFLGALTIVPLIGILRLSVPLEPFSYILWFLVISIPIFIATFVCIYVQGLTLRDVGLTLPKLKRIPIEVGIIFAVIPFGFIEYYIIKPAPLISELSITPMIVAMIIFVVCTGFLEELLFRGLLQHNAKNMIGSWGILLVTLIYATMYVTNLSILDVFLAFVIGGLYSIVVEKTGSLLGVSISHGVLNFILFIIAPFYF